MLQISEEHKQISDLIQKAENHALIKKSRNEIDWTLPLKPPKWLSSSQYICLVSNLIYGEKATVTACKILKTYIPCRIHKKFLDTQINDETYHAQIYSQYLELLGKPPSPSELWCKTLQENLEENPIKLILAFHILLEGEAVFLQKLISNYIPCPLFNDINQKICRDEARHIAFGKIILPTLVENISKPEKQELLKWAKGLWFKSAEILVAEYLNPSIVKSYMVKYAINSRWKKQRNTLIQLGLS